MSLSVAAAAVQPQPDLQPKPAPQAASAPAAHAAALPHDTVHLSAHAAKPVDADHDGDSK